MKDILNRFQPKRSTDPGAPKDWVILYPGQFCLIFSTEEEANKIARALTLAHRAAHRAGVQKVLRTPLARSLTWARE